jgi:hypothetical protein
MTLSPLPVDGSGALFPPQPAMATQSKPPISLVIVFIAGVSVCWGQAGSGVWRLPFRRFNR